MKKIFTFVLGLFLLGNLYVTGVNIVDLRGISKSSILADTLADAASGSVIILDNTMTYTVGGQLISGSLTIMADETNGGMPVINTGSSALNIATGSVIDSIVFKKVKITGVFASGYVFNTDKDYTLGKLKFDSCLIRSVRGILRMKGTTTASTTTINATITNAIANNCIIDSINGYGVFNVDYLGCQIVNFLFSNSTINKAQKIIVSKSPSTSFTISNCTFYEAPYGGKSRYVVDISSSSDVTGPNEISNCIFGPGWYNGTDDSISGVRIGSSSTYTVTNSYSTKNYKSLNPIKDLIPYSGFSSDLFTDTTSMNFTIKDAAFAGKTSAGDPRWYYSGTVNTKTIAENGLKFIVTSDAIQFSSAVKRAVIYSLSGQLVKSVQNSGAVSTSELKSGLYLVKYTDENNSVKTQKFIK